MYYFIDLNEEPVKKNRTLQTVINNTNLDDQYYGQFRTLTVTGRGLIAPTINITDKVGTDGAWLDSSNYPPRTITVEALIQTKIELFQLLNAGIGKEEIKLNFTDDPFWEWHAFLSAVNESKEDSSETVIELEFTCLDPYKYKTLETEISTGVIYPNILFETIPNSASVIMKESSNQIKITNESTGKNIVVRNELLKEDEITFDFDPVNPKIYKKRGSTKSDITVDLDILSDFETFSFVGGNKITVTPASSTIAITYTERSL